MGKILKKKKRKLSEKNVIINPIKVFYWMHIQSIVEPVLLMILALRNLLIG